MVPRRSSCGVAPARSCPRKAAGGGAAELGHAAPVRSARCRAAHPGSRGPFGRSSGHGHDPAREPCRKGKPLHQALGHRLHDHVRRGELGPQDQPALDRARASHRAGPLPEDDVQASDAREALRVAPARGWFPGRDTGPGRSRRPGAPGTAASTASRGPRAPALPECASPAMPDQPSLRRTPASAAGTRGRRPLLDVELGGRRFVEKPVLISRTHGPSSLGPPMPRSPRRSHHKAAWLRVELHFLGQSRLLQRGFGTRMPWELPMRTIRVFAVMVTTV